MWVAQITEPAEQGQQEEQFAALEHRFPAYRFSIMACSNDRYYIIARPHPSTIMFPEDEGTEIEMLRFIVTNLIDELITGHMITDDQEKHAPPQPDDPVFSELVQDIKADPGPTQSFKEDDA